MWNHYLTAIMLYKCTEMFFLLFWADNIFCLFIIIMSYFRLMTTVTSLWTCVSSSIMHPLPSLQPLLTWEKYAAVTSWSQVTTASYHQHLNLTRRVTTWYACTRRNPQPWRKFLISYICGEWDYVRSLFISTFLQSVQHAATRCDAVKSNNL